MRIILTAIFAIMPLSGIMANAQESVDSLELTRKSCLEVVAADFSPSADVTQRCIRYSNHGGANDDSMRSLYMMIHVPDAEVESILALQRGDGSFEDIDYQSKSRGTWRPGMHNIRLCALAKLYVSPSSKWYHSKRLGTAIHNGMGFWFAVMPESPNWWHQRIGTPKAMGRILLMMRDELTPEELAGGLKVMDKATMGMTGQNRCWVAEANLMKALVTGDSSLVRECRDAFVEEIFVSDGEGLQRDWSFHQHGHQLQFGNYGLSFAGTITFWMRALYGTPYAFGKEQYDIISSYMKNGLSWCFWKGTMDPSACARQLFYDAPEGKGVAFSFAALCMAAIDGPLAQEFQHMADANLQPRKYSNKLIGAAYFPCSDFGAYNTARWHASMRMHSSTVYGFEFTNKENMNGWFSADGALVLVRSGKEYTNIFPYWDWRKVPGTTTYDDGKPLRRYESRRLMANNTSHVGGLASEDVLCTTIELCRDSLHALKSAFFFNDVIVNLGADIYTKNPEVKVMTTSLGQTHVNGKIRSGNGWVHHDGVGYILLDPLAKDGGCPECLRVSDEVQSGDWYLQEPGFGHVMESGRVFKCWMEHSPEGRSCYAYALLPDRSASATARTASKCAVKVLCNDKYCQAVSYKGETCMVFHEPSSLVVDGREIKAEEPCIIMLKAGKKVIIPETQW